MNIVNALCMHFDTNRNGRREWRSIGKVNDYLKYLLDLPKTVYFNIRFLPLSQALKLPIWVSRYVRVKECRGSIIVRDLHRARVKLGVDRGSFDKGDKHSYLSLAAGSTLTFEGAAKMCSGFVVEVGVDASMTIGKGFHSNYNFICTSNTDVRFGDNFLAGWNVTVRDTDGHEIIDSNGTVNSDKPISIGNHVWICSGSSVMKGSYIADDCVVGMNSVITKKMQQPGCLIVGQPARVVKENIHWNSDWTQGNIV